jgi:hypothetical protein
VIEPSLFLSLTLSLSLLSGWLVDDVAQFFKHCTARERENFVPYQFRCADKQREEERSNFNILIDIYFLPFYFFFFFFSPILRHYTRLLLYQTPAGSIAPTVTSPPDTTTASLLTAVTLYLSRCRRLECTSSVSPPDRVCQ